MSHNENSPLIDHSYYEDDDDDEEISCIQKWCLIICFIIILIVVILIFIPQQGDIDQNIPSDISVIPYQYQLSFKSHWYFGYLIETLPVEFKDEQPEYVLLAEIISTSTSWTFGEYEVREYRHNNTSGNMFPVKTVTSSLKDNAYVSFKTSSDANSTESLDPATCDYMISLTDTLTGYIYRKCANSHELDYTKISNVKGSTTWGLTFYDGDEIYALTSETQYWWNMNRRDVVVTTSAPFPQVIPAIYTAYYDTIQHIRDTKGRRHFR
ncbi:1218_t:CDS:2 [Funneliformis caledonium]|uniref:1218_t:CDS:1 n=1 Tax=Funneliformis caledonium TaxID=1117310 RepID=A0A9N9GT60_9GLOM|nr:1218_t:CDS:2 [Funneliformis caledonium]